MFGYAPFNYNKTISNEADYGHSPMWTKAKKSHLSTQKAFFSNAANT